MPTQWETFPIKLGGGLMNNLGRLEQGLQFPGSATVLQNFEEDVLGGYTRVLGHQKFSQNEVPGTGQIKAAIAVSASEVLAFREDDWSLSDGTAWTNKLTVSNSSLIGKTHHDRFNFDGDETFVIVDGVNSPLFYNAVTKVMTEDTSAPADVEGSSWVKVFKNHIFFAKDNMLNFTVPYDPLNYSTGSGAGAVNVGDTVTGLTVFRDELIIFCMNRILRLTGSSVSDFALSNITDNTGCLCGHTIQEVGGDIMYLGPDGIRYLSASERNNDFGLTRASDKIQNSVVGVINNNCIYSSVTISKKNQYRFFYNVPSTPKERTTNFIGVKFSNQTSEDISWSTLTGIKAYAVSKYQTRDQEFIVFSNETGHVQRMESGDTFDGDTILARIETPFMAINDPKIRKTFYKHTMYTTVRGRVTLQGQLVFDYKDPSLIQPPPFTAINNTSSVTYDGGFNYNQGHLYGSPAKVEYYNNVMGSGFVVSLNYWSETVGAPFNINFLVLEFRTNERK